MRIHKKMVLPYDKHIPEFTSGIKSMTAKERWVYGYVLSKGGRFVSPTAIGKVYGEWKSTGAIGYHSAAVSQQCKKLEKEGYLERNFRGHYAVAPQPCVICGKKPELFYCIQECCGSKLRWVECFACGILVEKEEDSIYYWNKIRNPEDCKKYIDDD